MLRSPAAAVVVGETGGFLLLTAAAAVVLALEGGGRRFEPAPTTLAGEALGFAFAFGSETMTPDRGSAVSVEEGGRKMVKGVAGTPLPVLSSLSTASGQWRWRPFGRRGVSRCYSSRA